MNTTSSFFNRSVVTKFSTTLQDKHLKVQVRLMMGAHINSHAVELKHFVNDCCSISIIFAASEMAPLYHLMEHHKSSMFLNQEKRVIVSEACEIVRTCNYKGQWRTAVLEVRKSHDSLRNIEYPRFEVPLTQALYQQLLRLLPAIVERITCKAIRFPEEPSAMKVFRRVCLKSGRVEHFLTYEEATRQSDARVMLKSDAQTIVAHDRAVARRHCANYSSLGTQADPICIEDDNCENDDDDFDECAILHCTHTYLVFPPTHILAPELIKRPSPHVICYYAAIKIFRDKIMDFSWNDGGKYTKDAAARARAYIVPRWTYFQHLCATALQEMQYNMNTPTAGYVQDLLQQTGVMGPENVALCSLNATICFGEEVTKSQCLLESISAKFFSYF